MGPRSHERGNRRSCPARGVGLAELQWGRVLMNAETRRRLPRTRTQDLDCFNGAAFS